MGVGGGGGGGMAKVYRVATSGSATAGVGGGRRCIGWVATSGNLPQGHLNVMCVGLFDHEQLLQFLTDGLCTKREARVLGLWWECNTGAQASR